MPCTCLINFNVRTSLQHVITSFSNQGQLCVAAILAGETRALAAAAPAGSSSSHSNAAATTTATTAASSSSGGSSNGSLVTSSMCPVVGLRSFWCQAGHKLLLHVLAFGGKRLATAESLSRVVL